MNDPVPRTAFGVSRVPVPCTALLHRHHALYSSESHELARKKAATRHASKARGATIGVAVRRRGGAHGLKKENLTRALLLFGICSVSFSSQFSLHGPESVKVRKLGIKQKYLVNHMICMLVLSLF